MKLNNVRSFVALCALVVSASAAFGQFGVGNGNQVIVPVGTRTTTSSVGQADVAMVYALCGADGREISHGYPGAPYVVPGGSPLNLKVATSFVSSSDRRAKDGQEEVESVFVEWPGVGSVNAVWNRKAARLDPREPTGEFKEGGIKFNPLSRSSAVIDIPLSVTPSRLPIKWVWKSKGGKSKTYLTFLGARIGGPVASQDVMQGAFVSGFVEIVGGDLADYTSSAAVYQWQKVNGGGGIPAQSVTNTDILPAWTLSFEGAVGDQIMVIRATRAVTIKYKVAASYSKWAMENDRKVATLIDLTDPGTEKTIRLRPGQIFYTPVEKTTGVPAITGTIEEPGRTPRELWKRPEL